MRGFNKSLVYLILIFVLFSSSAYADDFMRGDNEQYNIGTKELEKINRLYNYISNLGMENEIIRKIDPKDIVENYMEDGYDSEVRITFENAIEEYATKEIRAVFKILASTVVIALICGLLSQLQSAFSDSEVSGVTYYVCYGMVLLMISNSFFVVLKLAQNTIEVLGDFMEALMPVMIMLLASVGGFAQAALMDPIIVLVVDTSASIMVNFIFPMIILSFVLSFVNNLSKDNKVKSLSELLGQITLWVQGIMLTIFVGIITIRSMVSSSIDEVTLKTAKFTVDKFVPVVGKALSDSLATIAGYSLLLKNAIGTLGVIVIVIIILAPIIKIVLMSLMFKFTAALIEPISDSKIVDAINGAAKAITLMLSCVISISVMCFILVAIVAGTGKGIIFS